VTLGVGAHVQISNAAITGDSTGAISCGPADPNAMPVPSLALDGVSIDAVGFVISAYPCTVTATNSHFNGRVQSPAILIASPSTANLDRCVIEGHGVLSLGGGALVHVSNSLFVNQIVESAPSDTGPFAGTHFGNSASTGQAFASFTTFVSTKLLQCGTGLPSCAGGSDNGVCIDNSIITSDSGDAVSGSGCHVSYSIVMPQAASLSGAHNQVNVDPLFAGAGSYQLKSSSPAVDAADPNAVDSIDLAGTPRPQGARNDIGAYEYKP
jgi:hypothetical protein